MLASYLEKPSASYPQLATCKPELVAAAMRAGDVLLVDGSSRVSTAIKYLTQSTWSHAALCIVDDSSANEPDCNKVMLLEADVLEGVRIVSLDHYRYLHSRICRPVGLKADDITQAIEFAKTKVGHQYDTKNVFDLLRYLIQTPPVPTRWRRKNDWPGKRRPNAGYLQFAHCPDISVNLLSHLIGCVFSSGQKSSLRVPIPIQRSTAYPSSYPLRAKGL
jgi:hypothetical protein